MKYLNLRLVCVCTIYYLLVSVAVVVACGALVVGYQFLPNTPHYYYMLLLKTLTANASILPSINIAYYIEIITQLLKFNECVYQFIHVDNILPSSCSS